METDMKNVILNNGVSIPGVGFGTYKSTVDDGYRIILDAINAGYLSLIHI